MRILAIDPGSAESGVAVIEQGSCKPVVAAKLPNDDVFALLRGPGIDHVVIEMVASYGMAVGKEVFDTCVWIGRFFQCREDAYPKGTIELIYRRAVKLHHCGAVNAKDANITQALIDRFAYGQPNRGKGTKKEPGWFHGFASDIWQAYALAVYISDTLA